MENKRPVIIKRVKKVVSKGHHGGAWKIAYADFVTAMMAFFLLLWLISSTSQGDLNGIAEYFKTPLKVALAGGAESGTSSSLVKGYDAGKKPVSMRAAVNEMQDKEKDRERASLQELKARIEQAINSNSKIQPFKNQILLDITSEGLRIQIVDIQNRPMFKLGKFEPEPYAKDILHEIGNMLNQMPNKVSVSGHTDAHPYAGNGISNWELSSERAHASRREMIAGGMDEAKVVRVVGMSSMVLFDKSDPLNPINRRMSIVVMNKETEEAALENSGKVIKLTTGEGDIQKFSGVLSPLKP